MSKTRDSLSIPSADALLEAMSEAVYVVDRSRRIKFWNPAAESLTGYRANEIIGRRCRDGILNHVDCDGNELCRTRCPLLGTIRDGEARETHAFLHHRDGHRVPVDVRSAALHGTRGEIIGAVEVFSDDSPRKELIESLEAAMQESLTDALTGLANRRMLEQVLRRRYDEYIRYQRRYAVIFADIDHFKTINDTYGHEVGDRVLQAVASTLRECCRPSDTASRFGGEEFVLVAPVSGSKQAVSLAERMRKLVASGWVDHLGSRLAVTISIGVAISQPEEGSEELVKRADLTMLRAKESGRNRTFLADNP